MRHTRRYHRSCQQSSLHHMCKVCHLTDVVETKRYMLHWNISGKDDMLPSGEEAWRILRSIQNCQIRCFKDNRRNILMVGDKFFNYFYYYCYYYLHQIMQEKGFNLLTIIKATGTYRRTKNHDLVVDFLPPSLSEFKQLLENYRQFNFKFFLKIEFQIYNFSSSFCFFYT